MQSKNFIDQLNEFYLTANEYCKQLENIDDISKELFLYGIQKILTLNYLKASILYNQDEPEDEAEKFVTELDFEHIRQLISDKLGQNDKYVEIILPENQDPENFEAVTLSECFADIYQDLKNFATNFDIGNEEAIKASLSECLFNFGKFWGIRALAILSSIHNMVYHDELIEEETNNTDQNKNDNDSKNKGNWLINKRFNN